MTRMAPSTGKQVEPGKRSAGEQEAQGKRSTGKQEVQGNKERAVKRLPKFYFIFLVFKTCTIKHGLEIIFVFYLLFFHFYRAGLFLRFSPLILTQTHNARQWEKEADNDENRLKHCILCHLSLR